MVINLEDQELPNQWVITKLPDFTNVVMGQSPPSETYNIEGDGLPFFQGKTEFGVIYPSINKYCSIPNKIAEKGATLLSVRAPVGPTNLAKTRCCIGRGLAAIHPVGGVDPKFIFLLFRSIELNLSGAGTGSTFNAITKAYVDDLKFAVPPLNEQKRIVAKIEELFSELDNGIAALKAAREQLKVYRQAVLKHAFEGKLTAKWREENADKLQTPEQLLARIKQERNSRYQQQLQEWKATVKKWEATGKVDKKPRKPEEPKQICSVLESEVQDLYKLPEGWLFLTLGNFIDKIDAGKSFKCDERKPNSDEIGVAKVSAVTWGEYDESESKTCLDKAKVNPQYYIKKNDFILSRANTIELVGACVIAQKVTKAIMLSDKTLRINFTGIDQKYVLQYLRSHYGRNEIMERSTGNQESMRNIGQDRIRSIVIPVCSSTEMDLINNNVNKQLEAVLLLSKEIDIQILKTETLRQSILKKAFSGKLAPQDPNDEPASELLARIKTVKEQQKQPAKRKSIKYSQKKVNQET